MSDLDKKIPVILDTDIGSDIDDTWALAMLLKCPELDLRLVVSDTDDTDYRARLAARLLDVAGRTDVPVGVGINPSNLEKREGQWEWVKEYPLSQYPGTIHEDGVDAIIRTIMDSDETITLICIGPVPNIAEALRREPAIAPRTRFVGMHGAIRRGMPGSPDKIYSEYNVKRDIPACQQVFRAPWKEAIITPIDTCGYVKLRDDKYEKVARCEEPTMRAVIENYNYWLGEKPYPGESSVLFDTVAIHLAYSFDFLKMEEITVLVNDEGRTVEDASGATMQVAIDWLDLPCYEDFLVERLCRPIVKQEK
ncbi:MAG: nucleoside hydrolase [Candidatus Sumerlaeia bacterium]